MLYVGEHIIRLNEIVDPEKRKQFYFKNRTPTVSKLYRLVTSGVRFRDCLKDRPVIFDREEYGRTCTNLHREFNKLVHFTVGHGFDHLTDQKVINLFEKLMMSLHHDEAVMVNDIINGTFELDNAFEGEYDWVYSHNL